MNAQPGASPGESILSTITELEARFSGLKRLHEQSVERDTQLDSRQRALGELEATLRSRAETLREGEAEVQRALERSQQQQQAAAQRAAELDELRAELERSGLETAGQRRAVEERASRLGISESNLDAREKKLAAERETVERVLSVGAEREKALAEREHVVSEQDRRLKDRERTLGEDEKKIAGAEFKAVEQRQALAKELEEAAGLDRALREREGQLTGREREVEELKKRFAEQTVRVSEREERLGKVEAAAKEREAAGFERERQASEKESAAAARFEQVAKREQAVVALEQRAAERERTSRVAEEQLAERGRSLAEQERASGEKRRKVEEMEKARIAALGEVAAQEKALDELDRGVREREQEVESARVEVKRLEKDLAARQAQLNEEQSVIRRELAGMREELDGREARVRESESAIKERVDEVRREAEKVDRERAGVAEQARTLAAQAGAADDHGAAIYAGRQEQLQIQIGEANARRAAAETELAQAREEIERLTEETAAAESAVGTVRDSSREAVAARDKAIVELERELAENQRNARDLTERLEVAEEAATRPFDEGQFAEQQAAVEELTVKLQEITTVNQGLKRQIERGGGPGAAGAAEELARREQALCLLRERLEASELRCVELEGRTGRDDEHDGAATFLARDAGAAGARRERLRRYKSLLQGQARKIVQAQSALQKRHTDCEQVLAQRAKLAALAADLGRREKRMESAKARSGASAALLYVAATLGILGLLSWQLARQLWPGTYVATAVLEADGHGHTPSETELATWAGYHTDLLSNPSLIEVAAQRMAQRGIAQYASPADLRSKLGADLYHQSSHAGEITVELRNEGADRAKMLLDTLVTAMKSVSDASRDQRPDDLGLTIAQAATTGTEPLFDQQLEHAGALLGGGALAAGLFGLVVWNRLARAKHKFEHAQAVEAALNEVDWTTMEQGFKKPAPVLAAAVPAQSAHRSPTKPKKR